MNRKRIPVASGLPSQRLIPSASCLRPLDAASTGASRIIVDSYQIDKLIPGIHDTLVYSSPIATDFKRVWMTADRQLTATDRSPRPSNTL